MVKALSWEPTVRLMKEAQRGQQAHASEKARLMQADDAASWPHAGRTIDRPNRSAQPPRCASGMIRMRRLRSNTREEPLLLRPREPKESAAPAGRCRFDS